MPYSTPNLAPLTFNALASRIWKGSNTQAARARENRQWGPGIQPPPLIIEGLEGGVEDLVQVLSSVRSRSHGNPLPAAQTSESVPQNGEGPVECEVCILLVDMRRRPSGVHQPLTRIEIDSDFSATLTLILTDSGEDFTAGGEIRRTDRWHFRGRIVPEGLAALIDSVLQVLAAPIELPAKASPTLSMNRASA